MDKIFSAIENYRFPFIGLLSFRLLGKRRTTHFVIFNREDVFDADNHTKGIGKRLADFVIENSCKQTNIQREAAAESHPV